MSLKRTPLHGEHERLGARLVEFAGWEMPVQYEGIKAEHQAVRTRTGLFDVSHMGEVAFRGPDAGRALQRLLTRDVSRLEVGQAGYSAVCLESGGTVDDVIVYRREGDFLVVVNAANREKDLAHFRGNTSDLDVEISDETEDWALLALQGPEAESILKPLCGGDLSTLGRYRFSETAVDGRPAVIARTGYTGEDGFEIFLRPEDAAGIWRTLIEAGATPAGLGARDTLRLEAGISFAVHLDKPEEFIGQRALRQEKEEGLKKKLVGFELEGRGVARHGHPVRVGGEERGVVTSGTVSPTLGRPIGLAYVPPQTEGEIEVVIRGRTVPARIVPLPFYRRKQS